MVPELSLLNRADKAWNDDALLKREAVISVDDDVSVDDSSVDICDESACDCVEALKVWNSLKEEGVWATEAVVKEEYRPLNKSLEVFEEVVPLIMLMIPADSV